MAQYEEGQIEFAILSLVRDPLLNLVPALALNVKCIAAASRRLDKIKPDWREIILTSGEEGGIQSDGLLTSADAAFGLTSQDIDQARLPDSCLDDNLSIEDVSKLVAWRQELVNKQACLRMGILEEHQSTQSDEQRAAARGRDFGAKMQHFARNVKAKEISEDSATI